MRDVLLYDLTPHSDLIGILKAEVHTLSTDAARHPRLAPTLSSGGAHPSTIAYFKPNVESLTDRLTTLPTVRTICAISAGYSADHVQAARIAEIYRVLFYIASVLHRSRSYQ